jgi:hypothetical protein
MYYVVGAMAQAKIASVSSAAGGQRQIGRISRSKGTLRGLPQPKASDAFRASQKPKTSDRGTMPRAARLVHRHWCSV